MVSAVVLYTIGPRFESWIPYQKLFFLEGVIISGTLFGVAIIKSSKSTYLAYRASAQKPMRVQPCFGWEFSPKRNIARNGESIIYNLTKIRVKRWMVFFILNKIVSQPTGTIVVPRACVAT